MTVSLGPKLNQQSLHRLYHSPEWLGHVHCRKRARLLSRAQLSQAAISRAFGVVLSACHQQQFDRKDTLGSRVGYDVVLRSPRKAGDCVRARVWNLHRLSFFLRESALPLFEKKRVPLAQPMARLNGTQVG